MNNENYTKEELLNIRYILIDKLIKYQGDKPFLITGFDPETLKKILFDEVTEEVEYEDENYQTIKVPKIKYVQVAYLRDLYRKIDFSNVSFVDFDLEEETFEGCHGVEIDPQVIFLKRMNNWRLIDIKIVGGFDGVQVDGMDTTGSRGAIIAPQTVGNVSMHNTVLQDAMIIGSFDGVDVSGMNTTGSFGVRINPRTIISNLDDTILKDAEFDCSIWDFSGVDLDHANLVGSEGLAYLDPGLLSFYSREPILDGIKLLDTSKENIVRIRKYVLERLSKHNSAEPVRFDEIEPELLKRALFKLVMLAKSDMYSIDVYLHLINQVMLKYAKPICELTDCSVESAIDQMNRYEFDVTDFYSEESFVVEESWKTYSYNGVKWKNFINKRDWHRDGELKDIWYSIIPALEPLYQKIDFSNISFDHVKVAYHDFSSWHGVKIDPQTVYDRNMMGATLSGVTITGSFSNVAHVGMDKRGMIYGKSENFKLDIDLAKSKKLVRNLPASLR